MYHIFVADYLRENRWEMEERVTEAEEQVAEEVAAEVADEDDQKDKQKNKEEAGRSTVVELQIWTDAAGL
jgi:hypothetical protein